MKEICQTLRTLIATALGSSYTVVYGYVKLPAESDLPLISIIPVRTEDSIRGTGGLRKAIYTITIKATVSIKKYVSTTSGTQIEHANALVEIMEDRNADRTAKSTSILGVIQANPSISNYVNIANISDIDYQENDPQSYLTSATLTLTAEELIPNCA